MRIFLGVVVGVWTAALSQAQPSVKAKITVPGSGPLECSLIIDTGDSSGLSLHTPFVESHHLLPAVGKSVSSATSGVGGEAKEVVGRVQMLELGRLKIEQPVTGFAQATKGSSADPSYDGAIGVGILRRFKVTFDYSRQQMTLEPNKSPGEPYEADMSGTSLVAEGADFKTFKIVHVLEASPAAEAGLREGDLIMSIGGKPARDLSLAEIRRLFKVNGKEYVLGIKRGEQALRIKLRTKRLV